MKIGDQVFRAVLDTGATLSIVARRLLKTFRKTKTVAIRVGAGPHAPPRTRLGRTTPWTPLPTRPAPRNRLTEPEHKHKSNPSHTPKPLTLDS